MKKQKLLLYLLGVVLIFQVVSMTGLSTKRVGTIPFAAALLSYAAARNPAWKSASLLGVIALGAALNNAGYVRSIAVQTLILAVMYVVAAWLLVYVANARQSHTSP